MPVPAYDQLKRDVIAGVITNAGDSYSQIFSSLKDQYKGDINSPRRFDQTKTLAELITVLETRDVLAEDNVDPLKEIARRVNNSRDLLRKIDNYEASYVPRDYNYYVSENQIHSSNVQGGTDASNTNPYGINLSPKKRQRMKDIIIEEIGSYWRDLGRNLNVREYHIKEIDTGFSSVGTKTDEVLKKFEERVDPKRWFFILCEALDKTNRGDLTKMIQEVMTMNIEIPHIKLINLGTIDLN